VATTMDPSAVLGQLTEGYLKLPLLQKIIFPLLIVGSVVGIVFVSKWANSPDYVVLYSDLQPADASAVVEKLKSQKIKYEIRGDGGTVAISPPEMVHELRMTMASEGIPKGGTPGFELFDQTSLGTTTFVEKLKFIRGLQGELERTIGSIDAVSSARVHITQPEKTVFAKGAAKPTASVMLKLRGGGELDKKQIKGIQNLVAGSVEGLDKENVTIIDVYGNLLTPKEEGEDMMGIEANRLQYQHEVEKGYVLRVEQMLQKILGPGKVVARVTADMDFTQTEREEESYDPGGQVIRSERLVDSGVGGGSGARGGIPGVVSNISNDPKLLAPSGTGSDSIAGNKEQVKNYELSRAIIKSSLPRGKLLKLSVAVLVDGTYESAADAATKPDAPKVFKPLTTETLASIESVVKSAVGYDSSRGDSITVENIPFFAADELAAKEMDKKATFDLIFNAVSKAVPILFVLLFFFVIVKPLVRFLVTPTEAEVDLSRLLPSGIKELEAELESERSKPTLPSYEPSVDLEQLEELMAENSRIVKENPQQAALLIRYWLNDGRL
jgi:flagellar M-ring protein FliF